MDKEIYKAYATGYAHFNVGPAKTVEEAVAFDMGLTDRESKQGLKGIDEILQAVATLCKNSTYSVPEGSVTKSINVLVSREEESSTFTRVNLIGTQEVVEKLSKVITNHGELGL